MNVETLRDMLPSLSDLDIVSPAAQPEDRFLVENRGTYRWYHAVAEHKKPLRILETGVKYGYSAIAMCKGARAAGVEPFFAGIDAEADGITCNPIATAALGSLGIAHQLLRINTGEGAEIGKALSGWFGIVHVDADHSPEGIERELALANRWVAPNGLILVDDVDAFHVERAARKFAENIGVTPILLPTQHGLLVIDMGKRPL